MAEKQVAVVGAGIAGLTAALAFRYHGHEVDVLERSPVFSDVGTGLQLSPNATRLLKRLGLPVENAPGWMMPRAVSLRSARSLRQIVEIPAGSFAESRWRAPYATAARSDLHALLAEAAAAAGCRLHLGRELLPPSCAELCAEIETITGARPDLVIGADGVGSRLRRLVPGHGIARFSGYVAWRATIAAEAARGVSDPDTVTAFLAPRTHLVLYPVSGGMRTNLVAIAPQRAPGDVSGPLPHNSDGAPPSMLAGAHPAIRALASRDAHWSKWPLYTVEDGHWFDGNLILIGDAAHAMLPFAAQGAAMAIEDAYLLAREYEHNGQDAVIAARAFGRLRKPRVAQVAKRAAFNRFAYHAAGPVRLARDMVLALRPAESVAADLDWLYGWSPEDSAG